MKYPSLKKLYLNEVQGGKGETKTLFHVGRRPARPVKPRLGYWSRPWLKEPIYDAVVFMSDDWKAVKTHHGIPGNVYAYKIPVAAIKDAGGLHRYDWAREVIFPEEIWNKYNLSKARSGKVIDSKQAQEILEKENRYAWRMHSYGAGEKTKDKRSFMNWKNLIKDTMTLEKQKAALKFMTDEERSKILKDVQLWIKTQEPPRYEKMSFGGGNFFERIQYAKDLKRAEELEKLLMSWQ